MAPACPVRLPHSAQLLPPGPRHLLSSGKMAALHTLWTGLLLLGVLGILQIQADEAQVSPQPNFQQDKVRCSPARSPRREGGALWGCVVSLGSGELSRGRRPTSERPPRGNGISPTKRAEPSMPSQQRSACVPRAHIAHADTRATCVPSSSNQSHPTELMTPRGNRHTFHTRVPGRMSVR